MSNDTWLIAATTIALLLFILAVALWQDRTLKRRLREAWETIERDKTQRTRTRQRLGWGDGTETQSNCEDCG